MALLGCQMMDYTSSPEGQLANASLADLAQNFRQTQSPFLGDYNLQFNPSSSPVSALGHGFNSPGVSSVLRSNNASSSTIMSQGELNERLQQLLALQQAHQSSPGSSMQNASFENLSQAALLLGGFGLEGGEQLSEGALLAALGASISPSSGSGKVGASSNPLYKTELCRSWEEFGSCRYGIKCQFAHSREELRPVQRHPKYKTEVCRTFATTGTCPYGTRCRFVHQSAALAQLRIATGNTPRANGFSSAAGSPFTSTSSIPGSPATDGMLLPALANVLQQAQAQQAQQAQQQQYSPSSSNGNLRSLSPPTLGNGGMHGSSSFGSLFGLNNNTNANMNGNNLNGYSGSSPNLGAVGDPILMNNNKLSIAVHNYQQQQQQNQHLSAPCTPHGNGLNIEGIIRRSTSDNALAGTPTAGANGSGLGAAGTPTSARRLPIFSALVEGDDLN